MNDDDFARDALRRIRIETKANTDRLGNQMADSIIDAWTKDPIFKETIIPAMAKCPTFLYADIFDAMAKRLTERFQSEVMWYEIEGKSNDK